MTTTAVFKARDLPQEARDLVQSLLCVPLREDDELNISLRPRVRIPTPEQKAAAIPRMEELFSRIDARLNDVPADELESAIDEDMAEVRPSRN
jgi:hypothetical protein